MNTIKRFWALCLDTHMKLALYKYAIIIIIIIVTLLVMHQQLMSSLAEKIRTHLIGAIDRSNISLLPILVLVANAMEI